MIWPCSWIIVPSSRKILFISRTSPWNERTKQMYGDWHITSLGANDEVPEHQRFAHISGWTKPTSSCRIFSSRSWSIVTSRSIAWIWSSRSWRWSSMAAFDPFESAGSYVMQMVEFFKRLLKKQAEVPQNPYKNVFQVRFTLIARTFESNRKSSIEKQEQLDGGFRTSWNKSTGRA